MEEYTLSQVETVELLEMPEIKLVGLAITSPFASHQPARVEAMKKEFMERKHEIQNVIHRQRYLSPHFTCEVLFTYMICIEVEDVSEIPEGMIGFTVPPHRYAKVKSKGEPYQVIHDYLKANSMESDQRALALELYHFDNLVWPDETEVYVPIK
jgi:predicted transcriptional regulator YdeE